MHRLSYGPERNWEGSFGSPGETSYFSGPPPLNNWQSHLRLAFDQPLEFPALRQAVLPEDRITIVLDRGVPGSGEIILGIWHELSKIGVGADQITILQPASLSATIDDPRSDLPPAIQSQIAWKIHDPTDAESTGYLASSLSGERVYVSRVALEADFVLPIGTLLFDSVLGYRSPAAAIYPGLSNLETIAKSHVLGHHELVPENDRPWGQLVDEVSWLLGVQFGIVAVPSAVPGNPAGIFAGNLEAIVRSAKELLDKQWTVTFPKRVETVVVSAQPADGRETTWNDVGRALATARQVVQRGGKIVLLSNLSGRLGPGIQIVQASSLPRECFAELRAVSPPDLVPATQWAEAADYAQLYVLSELPGDQLEELFCIPLDSEAELTRLMAGCEDVALINQANLAWATIEVRT